MFNNDGVLMIDWTWVEGCWGWGVCDVAVRRWYRCQWGWPDARNISWKLHWATSHVEIFYRDDTARFQQLNCCWCFVSKERKEAPVWSNHWMDCLEFGVCCAVVCTIASQQEGLCEHECWFVSVLALWWTGLSRVYQCLGSAPAQHVTNR